MRGGFFICADLLNSSQKIMKKRFVSLLIFVLGISLLMPWQTFAASNESETPAVAYLENGELIIRIVIAGEPSAPLSCQASSDSNAPETESEPTATTEDETMEANKSKQYTSGDLLINEFVSDPVTGEKEWVEVINTTNESVSLAGWSIQDDSDRSVSFEDTTLQPNDFAVVLFSSGMLNNAGDTITLFDPNGAMIDKVIFGEGYAPTAEDPNSVARNENGDFALTETPTLGAENVITVSEDAVESNENDLEIDAYYEPAEIELTEPVEADDTSSIYSVIDPPTTIRLSELYPNTTGSDIKEEFIEVENFGLINIDMKDWSLTDASGSQFTIDQETILAPGDFYTFLREETKVSLNNSGTETISLFSSNQTLVDELTYEGSTRGMSYALFNEAWDWTELRTPNASNKKLDAETENEETETVLTETEEEVEVPHTLIVTDLASVRTHPLGTSVQTEGIVSVEPGLFGNQIMYLSGSGIQVYKHDGVYPELIRGDIVRLSGVLTSNRGETRIKIEDEDTITRIGSGPEPNTVVVESINEELEGWLVETQGTVVSKRSDRFIIENEAGQTTIRIKQQTEIALTDIVAGAEVKVVGVVNQVNDQYYVLPRSSDDIEILSLPLSEEEALAISLLSGKDIAKQNRQNMGWLALSSTLALLLFFATRYAIYKKRDPSADESEFSFTHSN